LLSPAGEEGRKREDERKNSKIPLTLTLSRRVERDAEEKRI
jgi:hypothetical protein